MCLLSFIPFMIYAYKMFNFMVSSAIYFIMVSLFSFMVKNSTVLKVNSSKISVIIILLFLRKINLYFWKLIRYVWGHEFLH